MPTRSSFSVLRILEVVLVLSLLNTNSVSRAESQSLRRFTIKDSIELSQFSNPVFWSTNQDRPIGLIPSPDHRWALAITVKGVVATNTIESTIWLIDQRAIWDFVKEKSGIRPAPKLLAQLSATSNTPVITDVRWLEDCKTIAFLGKSGLLQQQIYVADIESGRLTQLTHEDHYVSGFDIAGDTMVYTTLKEPGVAADSQAELVDVTGRNIFSLLWRDRPLDERRVPITQPGQYSPCGSERARSSGVANHGGPSPSTVLSDPRALPRWTIPSDRGRSESYSCVLGKLSSAVWL